LGETQTTGDAGKDERVFNTTIDDIAHWAGMSTDKCRQVLNHFATQRRIEIYPDKIVVKNINDFARFVTSKRKARAE
ncbi:MAG TPA: Crp/Fnr family transcriptional regulator, partial [Spirochaetia bacterium]|nr:Crp/Fnr family transcriptional regulator [Spirochaetia bacterium]